MRPELVALKARVREAVLAVHAPLESLLREADEDGTGHVALGDLLALLAALGVEATDEEAEALARKYGDHRQRLRYVPFYRFLELAAPLDHADPEMRVAPLPQPYRMIAKVLETSILEPAWAQIEHKIAVSTGKAKQASERRCFPTFHLAELGTVTAAAASRDGRRVFCGNTEGAFFVADAYVGRQLARWPPPDEAGERPRVHGVRHIACQSPCVPEHAMRVAVACDAAAPSEGEEGEEKEKEKEAEAEAAGSVVWLLEVTPSPQDPVVSVVAQIRSAARVTGLTVDPMGGALAVAVEGGDVLVYRFAPMAPLREVVAVDEAEAALRAAAAERAPLTPAAPQLVVKGLARAARRARPGPPQGAVAREESSVQSAKSSKEDAAAAAAAAEAAEAAAAAAAAAETAPGEAHVHFLLGVREAQLGQPTRPFTRGLVVWWTGNNVVRRFCFPGDEDKEGAEEEEAGAEDGGGGEEEEEQEQGQEQGGAVELQPAGEWWFASDVTASAIDVSTSMVCVGLRTGDVQMWDTHMGIERYVLEAHESAVRSVAFFHSRYVASASHDQRVHICRLQPTARRASELVAVKHESSVPIVSVQTFSDIPVAVAVGLDGMLRVYDLCEGEYLGRLSTSRGGDWQLASTAWAEAAELCARRQWPPVADDEDSTVGMLWECAGDQIVLLGRPTESEALLHGPPRAVTPAAAAPGVDAPESVGSSVSGAGGDDAADGEAEEPALPPPPEAPPTRLLVFFTWDVLSALCPGVANSVPPGGEQAHFAKSAYLRMTMEQRLNPNARPPALDPPAGLMSLAAGGSVSSAASSRRSSAQRAARAARGSRSSQRTSTSSSTLMEVRSNASSSMTPGPSVNEERPLLPATEFSHPVAANRVPAHSDMLKRAQQKVLGPLHVREQRDQMLLKRRQEIRAAFSDF